MTSPLNPLAHLEAERASEVHQQTEQLLRDALDYLLRLPPHPMTADMARKISAHLEAPTTTFVRQHEERLAAARKADLYNRQGTWTYSPEGLAELQVSVAPTAAVISSPAAAWFMEKGMTERAHAFAVGLGEALAEGVTIELGARQST